MGMAAKAVMIATLPRVFEENAEINVRNRTIDARKEENSLLIFSIARPPAN
jgi:hypothetical protein